MAALCTRDLVTFLASYLRAGRVMVALTFRSDELPGLHLLRGLAELARNRPEWGTMVRDRRR
jgi:cytosine/adenosine deaminase-related metal-dependent hydrolase